NPPANTLKELLRERARAHRESVLLVEGARRLTYGEFEREVIRAAGAFARLGVAKGDKVALLLDNCPEFLAAVFGAAEIGAVFVPVNTAFAAEEVAYVLDHSEAKYLIVGAEYLPLLEKARAFCPRVERIIVLGARTSGDLICWEEFLRGGGAAPN